MPRSRGRPRVGNLPVAVTAFVGRDREVRDARRLLRDQRLVTLVGTGGVGKTRLAAHLGEGMARAFPGGVWLVDLGPLGDGADIEDAVRTTLGLTDEQDLATHLDRVTTLLVLDSCEHLLEGCVDFVTTLLRLTTDVRVLTTSRQPLGILGEHVLVVRPLSVPPPDTSPRDVEHYDAVRLFVERAGAVVPGFTLSPDTATTAAQVCARLGGVPLAIELAATRLRALSLAELADRLDDQHRLLTVGSRVAQPRQRSLGALHDWSHALCTPPERELWARLSVFADGFDLAAAESVCAGDGIACDDVLDLLAGLIEKSLVTREDDGVDVRYAMIEPIRQYGAGRLPDSGPYRRRHAAHYAALAKQLSGHLHDEGTPAVVRRERGNLAAAAAHLTPGHDVRTIRTLLELPPADHATGAPPDIPSPATGDPRLTPREHEVAGLVRDGLTNQAIGEALVISKRTVESHVEHIMAKLGFTRRTQIATWFTTTHPAADVTASTGHGAPRPTRRSAHGW